ncbi:MAG: DNA repair protein RecO [Candidatus Thiodiazotropha sp.]|jgi:DNA repair protein RecO (recombination protein O)
MSRIELIPAYLIHRRDYRDTSLLLELFSPTEGRFPAIAQGAKSGRSSRAILLQPFAPLRVSLRGRGEVKRLTEVELDGHPLSLQGERVYCGFYINELLMRLIERGDPYPLLYDCYGENLARLASDEPADQCLREFELQLLAELGYGLLLNYTADTNKLIESDLLYEYHLEQGPVLSLSGQSELKIHGRTLICLHNREPLDKLGMREAKRLMRRILAHYLGDRPLKSRELFQPIIRA